MDKPLILIRGGGDLASGVAARLHRSGLAVLVTELAHPLVVRRAVSFAEAVFSGQVLVEDLTGQLVGDVSEVEDVLARGKIPVLMDRDLDCLETLSPLVVVDARMRKRPPETDLDLAPMVVGLGPGFTAGMDSHAVVETIRGHLLGRVIWEGTAEPDTGIPDAVMGKTSARVLRAPSDGVLQTQVEIGEPVTEGQTLAMVEGLPVPAPFNGVLRGLVMGGLEVRAGMKLGDVDPRGDPRYAFMISDKALAIGGGVLEAILSRPEIRSRLYAAD